MPPVNHVIILSPCPLYILLSLCHCFPTSSLFGGQLYERDNHMLRGSQHHCILNSMLVNQNELKSNSSGLRALKISCSICWVLRIKTTGSQLVAAFNKIWLFCPIGCYYQKPELYHTPNNTFLLVGSDQKRKCHFPETKVANKDSRWFSSDHLVTHHNCTLVKFTLHLWFN